MLMPSIFGENLFDDFWDFPDFEKMERQIGKKLYGHNATNVMKVDVKDKGDDYEMMIDLPGFKKEEVNVQLLNGYLTISAAKGLDEDEQEKESGRYIRRERYAGACQRSFYIGDAISREDIEAEFKHGILKLVIPKKNKEIEQKENHYIEIKG